MFLLKAKKTISLWISLVFFVALSCNSGWSIVGYDYIEDPSSFIEITSSDSVKHYYKDVLRFDSDMWCFRHNEWETIRKK